MGIKSTAHITREEAISRIAEMNDLFIMKNYREIEARSCEQDVDLKKFVDDWTTIHPHNLENWTDTMLSDYMDNPFFRHSMFSNYLIAEPEDAR